uniref:Phot1 n=1 Tax=Arundo donax TaxID=35708 RepID=A0A0A9FSJ9_ARUDO
MSYNYYDISYTVMHEAQLRHACTSDLAIKLHHACNFVFAQNISSCITIPCFSAPMLPSENRGTSSFGELVARMRAQLMPWKKGCCLISLAPS